MVYYFSSEFTSAVKLNGVYLGLIDHSVTSIKIDDARTFVEICPINSSERTLNFILDSEFLTSPPTFASVTNLKGGYLIKFLNSHSGGEFKVFKQERFGDTVVTAYNENGVKISIETKTDFIIEPVFTECEAVEFYRPEFNKNLIAVALNGKKTLLIIFNTLTKIEKVFLGLVDEFSLENQLTTTENFIDMAKHRLTVFWDFNGDRFIERERKLEKSNEFNPINLSNQLLPYAFLEEFLLRGEIKPYLSDNILENADKLSGFLGEYIGVMPPPAFRDISEVGLIYKQTENMYSVEYFTFEFANDKISSIRKTEN